MKKTLFFVMALSVCALAAEGSLDDRIDGLQAQFNRVLAKSGIHFSGEFRSQFLSSTVEGDAVDDAAKVREGVEYTSVDFDITARPNTALSARAVFRLHQDWRNFFSDVQNPITARWLSIDGSVMDGIIKYNLGDYRKKLTPLTLWAPEVELLYEPEIFAQNRRLAMSEAFLGDNERGLQGGNLGFRAELYPLLNDLEIDLFGARISAVGTGESVVTPPGTPAANAKYDRYLVGVNLATQVIEGAGAGLSYISIFDNQASFVGDSVAARLGSTSHNVIAGRLNADNRAFMDDEFINIGVRFEGAFSSSDWYPDTSSDPQIIKYADELNNATGLAINAGLDALVKLNEENNVSLKLDYIMNEATFRNDAAQSPTFIQQAIMNNENSLGGLGMMNPFDAMYRSVFKFVPSQYFARGTTPYIKNAYNNSILKPEEVERVRDLETINYPNVFQASLPGGLATPDRAGVVADIRGSFLDKGVTVGAKVSMLETMEEYDGFKDEYMGLMFGAGIDIAKFAPVVGPSLVLGGSYSLYDGKYGDLEVNNALMSGELNYQFHEKFSLLGGYQMLTTNLFDGQIVNSFTNMAFGIGYKVADGGCLTAKVTMISGKVEADGAIAAEYSAFQPEVYLTVRF